MQIYSDFRTDFLPNPITGDLLAITNENAVIQSIKNIVLTSSGERWQTDFGGNTSGSLFENPSVIVEDQIKTALGFAIKNYEPRADVHSINVSFRPDDNSYAVTITFSCINIPQPIALTLMLQRVR